MDILRDHIPLPSLHLLLPALSCSIYKGHTSQDQGRQKDALLNLCISQFHPITSTRISSSTPYCKSVCTYQLAWLQGDSCSSPASSPPSSPSLRSSGRISSWGMTRGRLVTGLDGAVRVPSRVRLNVLERV